nr:MAG TPA: hypothetical protein [Caudoviricetes sp.]
MFKLFKKCNHEWEVIDEHYYFDLYSDMIMPLPKVKVIRYQCKKCLKKKKKEFW